jgi:type VII secretion protein EccB
VAQSRRDQVQAQAFVRGRIVNALVMADADESEGPHRRFVASLIGGLTVLVLTLAGFVAYGYLVPGGATAWRQPGVLIVEKETGSRYVFDPKAQQLRPVVNFASARLLLGASKVVRASSRSLAGVRHGAPVGIPGGPDALPAPGGVSSEVWTVCQAPPGDPGTAARTSLDVTESATAPGGAPLDGTQAIVVRDSGDRQYLVWQAHRFRLTESWLARLLGAAGSGLPISDEWLATVPVGPDLAPPAVPRRGSDGPRFDGQAHQVGELFLAHTLGGDKSYVLQRDGLAQLTPMAFAMLDAAPQTTELYGGRVQPALLSPAALAQLPVSAQPGPAAGLPVQPPRVVDAPADTAWCTRSAMADGSVQVVAQPLFRLTGGGGDGGAAVTADTADVVRVAPGLGGLVAPGRVGQAPGPSRYLITDTGVKFPVPDPNASALLGYPYDSAASVPSWLLGLMPTGPALNLSGVQG